MLLEILTKYIRILPKFITNRRTYENGNKDSCPEVFFCEFYEIFKNTYYEEHLRTSVSVGIEIQKCSVQFLLKMNLSTDFPLIMCIFIYLLIYVLVEKYAQLCIYLLIHSLVVILRNWNEKKSLTKKNCKPLNFF